MACQEMRQPSADVTPFYSLCQSFLPVIRRGYSLAQLGHSAWPYVFIDPVRGRAGGIQLAEPGLLFFHVRPDLSAGPQGNDGCRVRRIGSG
jgi:hypothetical protein